MTPEQIQDRWNQHRRQSALARLPRWLNWRINKKRAVWTGRELKREAPLFWGQSMTVVYPEFVSSKIAKQGYFEPELTDLFLDVLRPGMTVYDVGSHFGYFSLLASALVGDSGKVFAFEPTDNTFAIVSENAARRSNIIANNIAAYRETCEISFWDQGVKSSSVNFIVKDEDQVDPEHTREGRMIRVQAVKLDEFAAEHGDPDFLKLDAEGAEGPILEGMTQIIERGYPAVSLEVGDLINDRTGNNPCRENVQWLIDRGYEAYDTTGKAERHDVAQSYEYNNLLFRHPGWRFFNESGG